MSLPTPKWAKEGIEQAKDFAEQAEAKADSLLDKLIQSDWTWLILGVAGGLLLLAVLA